MRNNKKEIEYYNRRFVLHLSATRANADFTFRLNPPNEFAFNNNYSQCLIKIRKATLSNRGDATNFGLDAQYTDLAGAGQVSVPAGVLLFSTLKSQNSLHFANNTIEPIETGIMCVLHNSKGSASEGGAFRGIANDCGTVITRGEAAGGNGLQGQNSNSYSVNMWEYEDERPIENSGVLCSNPFGQIVEWKLRDSVNGNIVKLTSEANFNVAASNGSSINIELEVLMLPNPTPDDRTRS